MIVKPGAGMEVGMAGNMMAPVVEGHSPGIGVGIVPKGHQASRGRAQATFAIAATTQNLARRSFVLEFLVAILV